MIGEVLGNYRIDAQIGEGGMGVVYSARHELLGSKAAIKLLLPELSSNQQIVERFFNEAKAAAMINHPGLITVFDFGYHESGSAYIVMEFLEGESLASRLKRPGLTNAFVVEFMRQVALALQAAHDHKIVHRDLKPDNLFLCPDSALPLGIRVKILDFGIAKLAGDVGSSVKTRTGSMMGTPTYMAPEQCRGAGRVDHRADIYAMGCILFEMLAGRPPFQAEGVGEILGKHMYEDAPTLQSMRPDVHQGMATVVGRAIEKRSESRQQSVSELAHELSSAIGLDSRAATAPILDTPAGGVEIMGAAPTVSLKSPKSVQPVTTLGGAVAANATLSEGTGRRGLLVGALGLLVIAGIGSAIALRGGDAGPGTPEESGAAGAGAPAIASAVNPPADAGLPIAVDAAPAEVQSEVRLTIESEPSGAEVYRALDQVRVGRTPYEVTMEPVDGELVFILKRDGYAQKQVALPAHTSTIERVVLESTRKGKKKTRKPPSTSRPEGRALDPFAL
jgi:serine/threonine-protein kinase